MGGEAVVEAMAGLCHHSEEVHRVKMMPTGKLESYNFACISSILLNTIALFTVCIGTTTHLHAGLPGTA